MDFKFDFQNENFRRFFEWKVSGMSADQKALLPSEIVTQLFRRDGTVTTKKLSFMQMIYILSQSGLSNVHVCIEDENRGVGILEYEKFKKKKKEHKIDAFKAEEYIREGEFIISNKDIAEWLNFINSVNMSGATNYVLKTKKTSNPNLDNGQAEFEFVCNMFFHYESNKKRIIKIENLNMPDWYVLLYLADGQERGATLVYTKIMLNAINSSKVQILKAFKKLVALNYIKSIGKGKRTVYKITYLGKSVISDVLKKYVIP